MGIRNKTFPVDQLRYPYRRSMDEKKILKLASTDTEERHDLRPYRADTRICGHEKISLAKPGVTDLIYQ